MIFKSLSEEEAVSSVCQQVRSALEELLPLGIFEPGGNQIPAVPSFQLMNSGFSITAFSTLCTAFVVFIVFKFADVPGSVNSTVPFKSVSSDSYSSEPAALASSTSSVNPTSHPLVVRPAKPAVSGLSAPVKAVQSPPVSHEAAPEPVGQEIPVSSSVSSSASGATPVMAGSGAEVVKGTPWVPGSIRSDNKVGVYLTAESVARNKFFNETLKSLGESHGSALVFDVKGGAVLFHSAAPMANEVDLVRSIYELPEILRVAREKGMYTIGRFVAIKDGGLTMKKPETRVKHPVTGKVLSQNWVDPSDETAIEYNMQVICELAAAGIDEINLDYIRFSTAEVGALSAYTGKEKADRVEVFVKAARDTINRCGPKTKLGLSTYAILGWNYPVNLETLGQDVVRFAPLVDVISPMAYPATFAAGHYYRPGKDPGSRDYFLVYRTLTGYADLLGPEQSKKLRPWIQGYGVSTQDVTDEIKAVYDAGYCGFTVWNAGNGYAPAYAAMKNERLRPERCM